MSAFTEMCKMNLFVQPKYITDSGTVHDNFLNLVHENSRALSLDHTAIASILSLNYTIGDRTLFNEIKRVPWLSKLNEVGEVEYGEILPHGSFNDPVSFRTETLYKLLLNEARDACKDRSDIYILLSGGLDSRIVAGILHELYQNGEIVKPVAVTWGHVNSRDVEYAKKTAELLGFEWQHVALDATTLKDNIFNGFVDIAGLASPSHLHAMSWFKDVSKEALVIAGSYGDSIGRAEFSGRHLVEVEDISINNPLGVIKTSFMRDIHENLRSELAELRARLPSDAPDYAFSECQMQGVYMRNMIGQSMSCIGLSCTLYQMFTAPEVYGYIWSLHPATRNDRLYESLLENKFPLLSKLPWARTNRTLSGKRSPYAQPDLQDQFHDYERWCRFELYDELSEATDWNWFAKYDFFDVDKICQINEAMRGDNKALSYAGNRLYQTWLWLIAFQNMVKKVEDATGNIVTHSSIQVDQCDNTIARRGPSKLRQQMRQNKFLYSCFKRYRRHRRCQSLISKYPPQNR